MIVQETDKGINNGLLSAHHTWNTVMNFDALSFQCTVQVQQRRPPARLVLHVDDCVVEKNDGILSATLLRRAQHDMDGWT